MAGVRPAGKCSSWGGWEPISALEEPEVGVVQASCLSGRASLVSVFTLEPKIYKLSGG